MRAVQSSELVVKGHATGLFPHRQTAIAMMPILQSQTLFEYGQLQGLDYKPSAHGLDEGGELVAASQYPTVIESTGQLTSARANTATESGAQFFQRPLVNVVRCYGEHQLGRGPIAPSIEGRVHTAFTINEACKIIECHGHGAYSIPQKRRST